MRPCFFEATLSNGKHRSCFSHCCDALHVLHCEARSVQSQHCCSSQSDRRQTHRLTAMTKQSNWSSTVTAHPFSVCLGRTVDAKEGISEETKTEFYM